MITDLLIFSGLIHALDKIAIIIYVRDKKNIFVPHNARWFFIHMVTNLIISYASFFDLYHCLHNPYNSLDRWSIYSLQSYQIAVISHLYHALIFYKHLSKTEWIHHVLMVGLAAPLAFMYPTKAAGASLFFMSGLPGFIDYLLLWLVKLEKFPAAKEKRIYVWINTWLRSPGCTCVFLLSMLSMFQQPFNISIFTQMCLLFWNGQYYMMKTCVDYGKKLK